MLHIRPVSDLRNKFSEIENIVSSNRRPVFLTKNGYGTMVVMSLDLYESLTHTIDSQLNEADFQAASINERLSHEEVFSHIRSKINNPDAACEYCSMFRTVCSHKGESSRV